MLELPKSKLLGGMSVHRIINLCKNMRFERARRAERSTRLVDCSSGSHQRRRSQSDRNYHDHLVGTCWTSQTKFMGILSRSERLQSHTLVIIVRVSCSVIAHDLCASESAKVSVAKAALVFLRQVFMCTIEEKAVESCLYNMVQNHKQLLCIHNAIRRS